MGYDLDAVEKLIGAPDRNTLASEALAFMGARLAVNGVEIPQPSAGACSLLEIVGSPYVCGGAASVNDARVAYFVCALGWAAAGPVQSVRLSGNVAGGLTAPARAFCDARRITPAMADAMADVYADAFREAITPFNFFPRGRGGDGDPPIVFGAEWLAAMQRLGAECGMGRVETLWTVPLAALGFLAVAQARFNGAKNVDRGNALDWSRAMGALTNE